MSREVYLAVFAALLDLELFLEGSFSGRTMPVLVLSHGVPICYLLVLVYHGCCLTDVSERFDRAGL